MVKFITVKIESNSEKAIEWTVDCLRGDVEAQQELRKKDTDDSDITIEIVEGGK